MKKTFLLVLSICLIAGNSFGQKFISDQSKVSFFSEAPMENIEAHNYKSKSIFDIESGEIVFSIPIRTFEFEKSLMQEHFNENYLESDKYPKSKFVGKISGFQKRNGKQEVIAKGSLEIHGIKQEVSVPGEIVFSDKQVLIKAKFPIRLTDYKIKIPQLVASNIAEVVEVTVDFTYVPYEK